MAEEAVVPATGVPMHIGGGVKVYILPEPGHTVLELFAVAVLDVCVVVVILWKLVAVVPLMPFEAEVELPPTEPYLNSIAPVVSYSHTCIVLLAAPVVLRGMVTNHCTTKILLGAVPFTT